MLLIPNKNRPSNADEKRSPAPRDRGFPSLADADHMHPEGQALGAFNPGFAESGRGRIRVVVTVETEGEVRVEFTGTFVARKLDESGSGSPADRGGIRTRGRHSSRRDADSNGGRSKRRWTLPSPRVWDVTRPMD